jgi:DNA-binding GntR family transcriptional regulator
VPETSKNLTQAAYDIIRRAVVTNKLKPGISFSGNQLARYLNMSRTPVREAIHLLANEGLLEMKDNVGFFVKAITMQELKEIIAVRVALEKVALETAINIIGREKTESLIGKWREAERMARKEGDIGETLDAIVSLDAETHHLVVNNCNNGYLARLLETIEAKVTQVQYLSVNSQNMLLTIEQHVAFLEALLARDLVRAAETLQVHFDSALRCVGGRDDYWVMDADTQVRADYIHEALFKG